DAVIGEHDADQPALAGDRAQRSYAVATPWMRIEAHFNVGRSSIGNRDRLAQEVFGVHRRFAYHRADRSFSSDGIGYGAPQSRSDGTESSAPGLHVDDVSAVANGGFGLLGIDYAGKHKGH